MHDKNGSELMGSWHPTGCNVPDNQCLIGNQNQRKKSLSKLWLKLETSFSLFGGTHEELRMARVTPDGVILTGLLVRGAWWQESLTSHVQRRCQLPPLGCLDAICAVPPLAPSSSLQMPSSALPSCRREWLGDGLSLLCCFNSCFLCMGASSGA